MGMQQTLVLNARGVSSGFLVAQAAEIGGGDKNKKASITYHRSDPPTDAETASTTSECESSIEFFFTRKSHSWACG